MAVNRDLPNVGTTAQLIDARAGFYQLDPVNSSYVYVEKYYQLKANYTPQALGTESTNHSNYYLIKEEPTKDLGGGVVEINRHYAVTPSTWFDLEPSNVQLKTNIFFSTTDYNSPTAVGSGYYQKYDLFRWHEITAGSGDMTSGTPQTVIASVFTGGKSNDMTTVNLKKVRTYLRTAELSAAEVTLSKVQQSQFVTFAYKITPETWAKRGTDWRSVSTDYANNKGAVASLNQIAAYYAAQTGDDQYPDISNLVLKNDEIRNYSGNLYEKTAYTYQATFPQLIGDSLDDNVRAFSYTLYARGGTGNLIYIDTTS